MGRMQPFSSELVDPKLVQHVEDHGGNISWDPETHKEIESLWVAGMRGRLLCPNLFVYFNLLHSSYVLAEWKLKPGTGLPGVMLEIDVLPGNPDALKPNELPTEEYLRRMLRTTREINQEAIKFDKARKDETKRLKEEALRLRNEHVKYLRSKKSEHRKDDASITGIETGRIPWNIPELAGRKMN